MTGSELVVVDRTSEKLSELLVMLVNGTMHPTRPVAWVAVDRSATSHRYLVQHRSGIFNDCSWHPFWSRSVVASHHNFAAGVRVIVLGRIL